MENIYLDNAASTKIREEVVVEMTKSLLEDFGNPSSTHSFGRFSKNTLELCRKKIAKHFNASAQEILFTSGATEANNWVLKSAVQHLKINRIITSKIEHHAVLHTIQMLQKEHNIEVDYVKINSNGTIDISDLVSLLSDNTTTLVSLMHVNNEIGTLLDLSLVSKICKQHNAFFHSDTVQTVGKINIDLQKTAVDFIVASAHKFHGPKGVGFIFVRKGLGMKPLFYGGEQEKGLRAGTEPISNIVGLSRALEISLQNLESETNHIQNLRNYAIKNLISNFEGIKILGDLTTNIHTIINFILPFAPEKTAMILFNLDRYGIAVSRGSACQSGSIKPSHVLAQFVCDADLKKPNLRISFSHQNTSADIDKMIEILKII